jgi:hypothetical protein
MMGEDERHTAYEHLVQAFSPEGARAIMSLIPPFAWERIATKDDVRALDERLTGRIDAVDERLTGRFDAVERKLDTLQAVALSNRTVVLAMVGAVAAIGALAVAIAGLAG